MAKKPAKKDGPSGLDLLKADLKTGRFGRLYLFHGEEHYLRDHYLKLLQDQSRENSMTVVIITHNSALTAMADRIIQVKSGQIRSVTKNDHIVPVEELEW